jgi:hypothetical protein
MREVGQLGDVGCNLPRFIACEISPDHGGGKRRSDIIEAAIQRWLGDPPAESFGPGAAQA